MINLHIISQINGSIGEITNKLTPYFESQFKVTYEFKYENPEIPKSLDILLMHFINPAYVKSRVFEYFKFKVLIQPIDGTHIKEEYISFFKKFDLIIVPSISNRKILINHGILKKKIIVIPNFITKEDIWQKKESHPFIFYTELYDVPRKNIDLLIETYSEQFKSKDTQLIVKGIFSKERYKHLKKIIKSHKSNIKIINGYISKEELKNLWKSVDCYLNFSGIEGFSIPMLRFQLNKIPIIALDNQYSGYNDFIDKKYLVDSEYINKTDSILYTEDSLFAMPNKNSAIQKMKAVINSKAENNLDINIFKKYELNKVKDYYIDIIKEEYFKKIKLSNSLKIKNNESLRIKYHSPYGTSGYAIAGKEYLKILSQNNEVFWNPFYFDEQWEKDEPLNYLISNEEKDIDLNIIHSTPEWWKEKMMDNVVNVGMTVWETDLLHPDWIDYINQVDVVVVPSEWNKKVFIKSGITKPIEVIPHSINIEDTSKIKMNDGYYRFYTIGQYTERKGIKDTLIGYLNEFTNKDNVILTIKSFYNNYSKYEQDLLKREINSIINEYQNPAKVDLILSKLSYNEILDLHRKNYCYVSACKSEGWGLGAFEAIHFKNPVIMTSFGGQSEFLKDHPEFYIPYELVSVKGMKHIPWYKEEQKWAHPNIKEYQKILRNTYTNQIKNVEYNIEEFKSDIIQNKFKNLLIYAKRP